MKLLFASIISAFLFTAAHSQSFTQVRYISGNQSVDEWRAHPDTVFVHDTVYIDSCRLAREDAERWRIKDSAEHQLRLDDFYSQFQTDTIREFSHYQNTITKRGKTKYRTKYKNRRFHTTRYKVIRPRIVKAKRAPTLPTEIMVKTSSYHNGKLMNVLYQRVWTLKLLYAIRMNAYGRRFIADSLKCEVYIP